MKVSGFTIVRNAELMDYPITESIRSALPLVDEMVVGVGQSEDNTKGLIEAIGDPKIKIFDSHWDTSKSEGGLILSEKTNEALDHCENDWCFYLQGDEVLHEQDLPQIYKTMEKHEKDTGVQGLLFRYIHFYGSHHVIATSRKWYRHEIRAVKKSTGIRSHGDAQGFRVMGEKPIVRSTGARVFHYGWVKPPQKMGQKKKLLDRLWHGNKKDQENESFQFQRSYGLREFKGSHPAVMRDRVQKQSWVFDPKLKWSDWTLGDINNMASDVFEKVTGYRIGEYKNYRLIKE
jgi:hypothetical protein